MSLLQAVITPLRQFWANVAFQLKRATRAAGLNTYRAINGGKTTKELYLLDFLKWVFGSANYWYVETNFSGASVFLNNIDGIAIHRHYRSPRTRYTSQRTPTPIEFADVSHLLLNFVNKIRRSNKLLSLVG